LPVCGRASTLLAWGLVRGDGQLEVPFGSWPTPITSELVVKRATHLSDIRADGDELVWSESRPGEGGRTALVRRSADGTLTELLGADQNARTAAHEYGGGAWWVHDGVVWFTSWRDQRVYRRDPDSGISEPITPEPELHRGDRYADGSVSPDGQWIACVREHHPRGGRGAVDVRNEIVRLAADRPSTPEVLVSGPDFVSSPRWSPDGRRLCWIEWDHPNMPWDGTRLHVRDAAGSEPTLVAGGPTESVSEPAWRPDGSLTFISDRSGWWNLYRSSDGGGVEPLVEMAAEIGVPQWAFGLSRYATLEDGRIVFARGQDGLDTLAVRLLDGSVAELDVEVSVVRTIRLARGSTVAVVAASPAEEPFLSLVTLGRDDEVATRRTVRPGRTLEALGVDPGFHSGPEPIDFRSTGGRAAHALFYQPANPDYTGPGGALPPLIVEIHGGPTGSAWPALQLDVVYWTSRGFAFVDVNYGGSTGYGRSYRELLRGEWGVVDVEDCIAAAAWLAEQGRVDVERMCIRGGSAGGFTTLAALARADTPFAAGADYFGVADLEAMEVETHKFESRYLDSLIGPYPEARELYRDRSPIHHVDAFTRPLIVLQGLEDEVVPPNQATMIVEALRAKGVPVAYVPFEGEQHGFRRAENIRRALDAELSFYAQILGFDLPVDEAIEPVEIDG
jgi:dipeptidyl aminopeptidase/acylaminoacyl peptidase